ncbi:MAG TPA: hypothetical protein VK616_09765 [Flavitalea sp.]|nr:hypothetical protein [Flavitalea sp.]
MRLKDRSHYANHMLNELDSRFRQFISLNTTALNRYFAKTLRDKLMGDDHAENPGLITYLDEYFEKAVARNKERACGNSQKS